MPHKFTQEDLDKRVRDSLENRRRRRQAQQQGGEQPLTLRLREAMARRRQPQLPQR